MATERKKAGSTVETARAVGSEDLEAGAGLLDAAATRPATRSSSRPPEPPT